MAVPNMVNRTPSEQVVIVALKAVPNYPESNDIVETVSRALPGLQTLLDTPIQPEGCMLANQDLWKGPGSNAAAPRALSHISALSPVSDEKPERIRSSLHKYTGAPDKNESPTSGPLPDKRQSDAIPGSVVIPEPLQVSYRGFLKPQLSLNEVMERYASLRL